MVETRVMLTRGVGILAIVLTVLWCAAGAGIYGPAILTFHGWELVGVILALLVGPLSILPAGVVGGKRPLAAGMMLLASSLLIFLGILGVILYEEPHNVPYYLFSFPALGLWSLLGGPQFLLSAAFLWDERHRPKEWWQSARFRRGAAIGGGLLAGTVAVVLLIEVVTSPVWTVTVTPEGGAASSMTFDPRNYVTEGRNIVLIVDKLFERRDPSRSPRLGKVELEGPGHARQKKFAWSNTLVAERTSRGGVVIRHNGYVLGQEMPDDRTAIFQAKNIVVTHILGQAAQEWRPPRNSRR